MKRYSALILLLTLTVLALFFSGCCGVCKDSVETYLEKAEVAHDDDQSDEPEFEPDDKPEFEPDDDNSDEDSEQEANAGKRSGKKDSRVNEEDKTPSDSGPKSIGQLTPESIKTIVSSKKWKLIGEPKINDISNDTYSATTIMLTIIKPPRGGSIALYKTDNETVAINFENGLKESGAVKRDGNDVLAVIIPGHKSTAEELLNALTK